MIVQLVKVSVMLDQSLEMSLVSLLGSDMRRCISIIILSVEVVAGLYEHLQDVETIREAGRQM